MFVLEGVLDNGNVDKGELIASALVSICHGLRTKEIFPFEAGS